MQCLFVVFLAILFVYPAPASGQDGTVWKGLAFDTTTSDEALAAIGKPAKKRSEKVRNLDPTDGKGIEKREIQILDFEKIDGWKKVSLSFYKDKLFNAKFWPKNKTLPAAGLPAAYQADFVFVEGFAKGVSLSVFAGQKEPAVPRVYPTVYFMVSALPDRYIVASVNNGSFRAPWKEIGRAATVQMFPGWVEDIQIVSRAGEPK